MLTSPIRSSAAASYRLELQQVNVVCDTQKNIYIYIYIYIIRVKRKEKKKATLLHEYSC
jgi:hypothetical protein